MSSERIFTRYCVCWDCLCVQYVTTWVSIPHHFFRLSIAYAFSVWMLDFLSRGEAFTQFFHLRCTGAKEKSDEKGVNGEVVAAAVAAAPAANHTGRIFQWLALLHNSNLLLSRTKVFIIIYNDRINLIYRRFFFWEDINSVYWNQWFEDLILFLSLLLT